MKIKKIASSILFTAMSLTLTTSAFVPYIENQAVVSYASESVNVAQRTPQGIKQYFDSHPFDTKSQPTFSSQPSAQAPYAIGKIDDATAQNALNALNCMRYIAGLPEVTLNDEYSELAQAASLVNCVNNTLSHYPTQPAGMPDDIYDIGKKGACSSNICGGTGGFNIAYAVTLYMYDSDNFNVDRVGHRRWCINPNMSQTGFGTVGNYSAMYSFDMARPNVTESNVCWPAQAMPTEYFAPAEAWSISLDKIIDTSSVKVSLVRTSDSKEWNFSSSASDGDFYINSDFYGCPCCIIFRPSDVEYNEGDKFDVKITASDFDIEYSVDFFSLSNVKTETVKPSLGNVNGDNYVDANDASMVLGEYANNSTGKESTLTEDQKKCADVNSDGIVDANDASKILEYYAYVSTVPGAASMESWILM